MSLTYSIKEAVQGLIKSKFSSLLSIITIAISIFLMGVFITFIFQGWRVAGQLKSQIEMEVFLKDGIGDEIVRSVQNKLKAYEEVDRLSYISKEAALQEFKTEFGENVVDVIGKNPLPASFQIKIKPDFHDKQKVEVLQKKIESLAGVDEVIYRYDLLQLIMKYLKILIVASLILGAVLFFTSVILISNTIRMSIKNKRESIHIMELVGATPSFIRRPFIFEGAIQGMLGALLAVLCLVVLARVIMIVLPGVQIRFGWINYALIFWGIFLGTVGSRVSIKRYLSL